MLHALQPSTATGPIPDLLSAEAEVRVDLAALRQMLVFAFAAGGSIKAFEEIIGATRLPATSWRPGAFARDLFVEDLVVRGFRVRAGGRLHQPSALHLARAISSPPRDPEVLAFRRAVLTEIAGSKETRAEIERIYVAIVELRALFCAGAIGMGALRRLDILRLLRALVDTLAGSFAGASSGLSRVRAFGIAARESESYRRLDALLDHEEHLGTIDLRVRVGADGELRTFQIVAVKENRDNPFHASPLGRWIAKIQLFWRGIRMNGVELVERLFDDVFTGLETTIALLFQLLGDIEFYLAGLGFRDLAAEKGLAVCFPDFGEARDGAGGAGGEGGAGEGGGAGMELVGLFNPLLLGEGRAPVPCDITVAQGGSVVLVTGPNSGGKTRLLQALALAQMLGEVGLFAPARSARMPRVPGLFVSLLDEIRADQPEGQLGMELLRIRRMFEELEPGSLVMLDELCSGTNPSEGEEIARLVISLLPELGAQVFVTTHLLQFAARLAEERSGGRLAFLQVELDARDRPTYGFVPGVARTSLAHKTAARLGVTRDELLELIEAKRQRGRARSPAKT